MPYSQDEDHVSISRFESMLKTNHILFFDSDEFENIIHHYLEQGKIALGKKAIKLGLEQHPTATNLQLLKVEILVIENKFEEADCILDVLHLLEPDNEEIFIQKANVFSKQDKHLKAVETLLLAEKLSKTPEEDADLFALIGMEYLFLEQFDKAIIYFKKCLKRDVSDYAALHNLMYCFDYLDETEASIEFLNKFLDRNPYCEVAWHHLGCQYFILKAYEKAIEAFDFAIISDETFVGAYIEKGKVLEKQKKYEEAIENYKITLALEDPTSFALLRTALCYSKLNKDYLALQYFQQTIDEDPLLDKAWVAFTRFYIKKNDYQNALQVINKALNIDGNNSVYWKLFAKINKKLNYIEEAEYGYKRALELGDFELDSWINRADVLTELGEHEAAIFNLLQASELFSDHFEIEYRLGSLYFMLNVTEKGQFHLKNALRLNKDYAFIILELFPNLENISLVQEIISKYKNPLL